jgi:hypothetical protein
MASSVSPTFGDPGSFRKSYTCAAAVTAGQLVERVAGTDLVQPAGAASVAVVGVAAHDVPATRTTLQGPQVGDGHELTVLANCEVPGVTASGAIAAGDPLIAAAAGKVAASGATPDARTLVGRAAEAIADTATGRCYVKVA